MSNRRARLTRHALTTTLAVCGVAALASEAQATTIDGDLERFVISDSSFAGQPPLGGNDVYAVDVATVDGQSVWRLTTESPIRGVLGTCTRISGVNGTAGPSEIHCRRGPAPAESTASLGRGDDQLVAAPGFPDRLRLLGDEGNDTLVGGAANDVIVGGDGNNVLAGNDGDDSVTLGNPPRTQFADFPGGNNVMGGGNGNDFVFGGDGDDQIGGGPGNDSLGGGRGTDGLNGGEGDDSLNGTEDAFQKRDRLLGGPGSDRYLGDFLDQIIARDGVPDRLGCRPARFVTPTPDTFAEIDLQDTVEFGDPCPVVLRAPIDESPSVAVKAATAKLKGRVARIKVRCATAAACRGKVSFELDRRSARKVSATYRVAGNATRTVSVRLRAKDARKVTRRGSAARVTLLEQGIKGERTVERDLTVKR